MHVQCVKRDSERVADALKLLQIVVSHHVGTENLTTEPPIHTPEVNFFLNTPVYRSTPLPCKPHLGCAVSFYIFSLRSLGLSRAMQLLPSLCSPQAWPLDSVLSIALLGKGNGFMWPRRKLKHPGNMAEEGWPLFTWPWERQGKQASKPAVPIASEGD